MIGGKRFKTLREARKHLNRENGRHANVENIYIIKGRPNRVYRYFVGSHIEWLNL